jgi:hypothetical protein
MRCLLAWTIAACVALAGCSGGSGDTTSTTTTATTTGGTTSGTGTTSATGTPTGGNQTEDKGENRPPTASLKADPSKGGVPLNVSFALQGEDPDGDALSWTLELGDGSAARTGEALPATVNHSYAQAGNFTVRLTVTDGELEANQTFLVAATAAAGPSAQDPIHIAGTSTGVPNVVPVYPPVPDQNHAFKVEPGNSRMTITLAYPAGPADVNDLDMVITDPGGTATVSDEIGPEPPLEFSSPQPGDWNIRIRNFSSAGEVDYTIDITFE